MKSNVFKCSLWREREVDFPLLYFGLELHPIHAPSSTLLHNWRVGVSIALSENNRSSPLPVVDANNWGWALRAPRCWSGLVYSDWSLFCVTGSYKENSDVRGCWLPSFSFSRVSSRAVSCGDPTLNPPLLPTWMASRQRVCFCNSNEASHVQEKLEDFHKTTHVVGYVTWKIMPSP